jgi:hypothetical protein
MLLTSRHRGAEPKHLVIRFYLPRLSAFLVPSSLKRNAGERSSYFVFPSTHRCKVQHLVAMTPAAAVADVVARRLYQDPDAESRSAASPGAPASH